MPKRAATSKTQQGLKKERERSCDFHAVGFPLLVSPLLLRSLGGGQVDLARVHKRRGEWVVEVVEVKTWHHLSAGQAQRLRQSADFLGQLFGCEALLVVDSPNTLGDGDVLPNMGEIP